MERIGMKKTDYDEKTYYEKIEEDLFPLVLMTQKFEELISDYDLAKTEDVWDEDFNQVVRVFYFEKGTNEYIISITPDGLIRGMHSKYPSRLSHQVHNVVVGMHAGKWMKSTYQENRSE
jgi:hypothetical protein